MPYRSSRAHHNVVYVEDSFDGTIRAVSAPRRDYVMIRPGLGDLLFGWIRDLFERPYASQMMSSRRRGSRMRRRGIRDPLDYCYHQYPYG